MDAQAVFETYQGMVYRLAFSRAGNRADADDVLQDVFLRYLQNGKPFESEAHRRNWLIRVTIQCGNRRFRSAWFRRTTALTEEIPAADPELVDLSHALAKLPQRDRTVIHLFYYEDCAIQTIAEATNQRPSTVRAQLTRARARLGELLKEDFGDVSGSV